MTIQLVVALRIAGAVQAAGTQVTLSEALEADLIYQGKATRVGAAPDQSGLGVAVSANTNPLTGVIDFSGKLAGNLVNGEWFNPPSIFRLLLKGTGTVTIDSKDAAGTITTGVYSTTLSSAVNEIAFPYAGDSAIQIRATLTGSATAKVI